MHSQRQVRSCTPRALLSLGFRASGLTFLVCVCVCVCVFVCVCGCVCVCVCVCVGATGSGTTR